MNRIIGPTRPVFGSPASSTPNPPMPPTGNGPFSMNNAVMKPQAMNAAMFGMIIPDRNVPNFWTAILAPDVFAGAAAAAVTVSSALGTRPDDSARWTAVLVVAATAARRSRRSARCARCVVSVVSHIWKRQGISAKMGAERSDEQEAS